METSILNIFTFIKVAIITCLLILNSCSFNKTEKINSNNNSKKTSVEFTYEEIKGIGKDSLYNRRDNSDIIKVGDTYYIWYSRMDSPITPGYWATIWYATSTDEGFTWQEQGMALGLGEKGSFDSHSVFTPNILAYSGKFYLYYTAVKPTPGNPDEVFEGNNTTDITAIGLAISDNPNGPFERVQNNPVLEISRTPEDFDSYRIDDASLLIRDDKIWLYYKGRSFIHGAKGPRLTEMSVAFSDHPEGPFIKHKGSLLDKSHEVLIWKKGKGVASLASISQSINYAEDGIHFAVIADSLHNIPKAPGLYRPDLSDNVNDTATPGWGVSMKAKKGETYLLRYEMTLSNE